ncbi:MAG: choice-of-anchor V domain-containing protein [Ginsengibacter sp.]
MLQKSTYLIVFVLIFVVGTSAVLSSFRPPQGATGATPGVTCSNQSVGCHSSFPDNSGGGSVTVTGLPTIYTPGVTYNFSLTITHGLADRTRWGFSILANNSGGTTIGSFSSTNPNASPNGAELSHGSATIPSFAPVTPAQSAYTFDNLSWTAPATDIGPVTFYYAGVAADNAGGAAGDYVYTASSISASLPITLYSFNAVVKNSTVLLSWQTAQEINSNYFTVQKSYDNRQFNDIGKIGASGNSSLVKNYSFTDDDPSYFEKPIYYRLAMIDKDGAGIYSKIANVVLRANATFIKGIYPNPLKAGNMLHVNFVSRENQMLSVKLIDNAGRLMKSKEISANKGSNILNIEMPIAAPGNYKLIIKSSEGLIREPLMIR